MADWNAELFKKLYSKMALALGVTPTGNLQRLSAGEMLGRQGLCALGNVRETPHLLAMYNPGQYIPAQMDPEKNPADRYALSTLFDVVPQFSWVFKPASVKVSTAYGSILDYHESPQTALTEEQKKRLSEAEAYCAKHQEVYEKAAEKYEELLDQYTAALATEINGGEKVPESLKSKLRRAYDSWLSNHKEGYESSAAVIGHFEALEPAAYWHKLQGRYREAKLKTGGNEFLPVNVSPPYKSWFSDAGWTNFTFEQKDMDNQTQSEVIKAGGELKGELSLFKISGDGSYSKDTKTIQMNQTELNFSCQLMRVSLDRNWMNPLVLSSSAWRWAKGSPMYASEFSSGWDGKSDVAPTGNMTALPTAAILSRNLKVKGTFDNTLVKEMNQAIDAKASVGIGPFSISGRFNMGSHDSSVKGSIATNGIEAKDVQIVALVCEVLPKCPNPDNNLKWPQ